MFVVVVVVVVEVRTECKKRPLPDSLMLKQHPRCYVVSMNIISRKAIWYSGYVGDFKY